MHIISWTEAERDFVQFLFYDLPFYPPRLYYLVSQKFFETFETIWMVSHWLDVGHAEDIWSAEETRISFSAFATELIFDCLKDEIKT